MAMTDYFKKNACTKIVQTETVNSHGNKTVKDTLGSSFDGLLVKRALSETTAGARRDRTKDTYNLFVRSDAALAKSDKVRYTYNNGQSVYIRLTSNAILNEDFSGQTQWKTYEAETYETAVIPQ